MNKPSESEWQAQKTALESKIIDETDEEQWREFHMAVCKLRQSSPYDKEVTKQLVAQISSRTNDIWEALMWNHIDIENDRWIPEWRIIRKEISLEGYKTVLYRNPVDGLTYLFWEWHGDNYYLTQKKGKIIRLVSEWLQIDGSIHVVYKSDLHRELWQKIMFFRFTSIDPDDDEDDGDGEFVPPPMIPTGEELVI